MIAIFGKSAKPKRLGNISVKILIIAEKIRMSLIFWASFFKKVFAEIFFASGKVKWDLQFQK